MMSIEDLSDPARGSIPAGVACKMLKGEYVVRLLTRELLCCAGVVVLTTTLAACSKPAPSREPVSTVEPASTGQASASQNPEALVVGRAPVSETGTPAI